MAEETALREPRSFPRTVWLLLLALVALIVAGVFWAIDRFERDLAADVRAALQAEGIEVAVEFEGRDAVLSGSVSSLVDVDRAVLVVKEVEGVRDVRAGEVVVVGTTVPPATTTTLAPEQFPAVVEIAIGEGSVTLAGLVPAESRTALVAAAEEVFGSGGVEDNLQVDEAVVSPEWLQVLPQVFVEFGVVEQANVIVSDQGLEIAGIVKQARDVENLGIRLAQITRLQVTNQLAFTSLPAPRITISASGGELELTGQLPNQEAIDTIVAAGSLSYASIDDELVLAEVSDADWIARLPRLVESLSGWPMWVLELDSDTGSFTGFAPSTQDLDLLSTSVLPAFGVDLEIGSLEVDAAALAAELTAAIAGRITFNSGSSVLSAESTAVLDDVVEALQKNPSAMFEVQGHTDDIGGAEPNRLLSESRARAVVNYLVSGGVDPDRLTAVGKGEENPIASNSTAAGRAQNRRIEFVVKSEGGTG